MSKCENEGNEERELERTSDTVAILQIKCRKKLYRYIDNKEREEELFVSKSSNLNTVVIVSNHLEYLIIILLSKLETLGFYYIYIYQYRSVKMKGKNSSHLLEKGAYQ